MCRNLIAALPCFLFIHALTGQQVYQSADYGSVGTEYLYCRHVEGFTNEEIRLNGADVQWDLGSLTPTLPNLSEIISRDQAIDAFTFTALCSLGGLDAFTCFNIYNGTQQALLQVDSVSLIQFDLSDLKRFQRKTSSQLLETFFGFNVDLNGSALSAVIVYHSPDTILTFPMTYGQMHDSQITWGLDLSPTGQNIQYVSHQSRSSTVESWGTLITPFDTLEGVIRVRAEITRNDTLVTDTLSVPIGLTQVEYSWYDTAYGLPVMIAQGLVTDTAEVIGSISYLVDTECIATPPEFDVMTDAGVYYLDGASSAVVNFQTDLITADYLNWDFGDGTTATSTGDISHSYASQGVYSVIVSGCYAYCLPIECASDTLMFEVRDTTSGVYYPDPREDGIRIFPNPAQGVFFIEVPESIGTLDFVITDQIGRSLQSGKAWGNQTIEIGFPAGLYFIQFSQGKSGKPYQAERILIY